MSTSMPDFGPASSGVASRFDPFRVVVRNKWWRTEPYEPPLDSGWKKRGWHREFPLKDESGTISDSFKLADAECYVPYHIDIRCQPTVEFAQKWLRMHDELPASLIVEFTTAVKGAVRDVLGNLDGATVLDDERMAKARAEISQAVKDLLEAKAVTCDALCRFGRPNINWPVQNPDTPQPLYPGQMFYEQVRKQNFEFFQKQDKLKNDETAAKENQTDENNKAVAERAAARRKAERDRTAAENADTLESRAQADAHEAAIAEKDATKHRATLTDKKTRRIEEMDAEKALREHRLSLRQLDQDFIDCEINLFTRERERVRAVEKVKEAGKDLATEQEIHFLKERARAEHLVEMEKHGELLEAIVGVAEKLSKSPQPIEQLRVVQINGEPGLPNSVPIQIMKAVALVREFLAALK